VDVLTWKFGKIQEDTNAELSVKRIFTPPTDFLLERRLLISVAAFRCCKNYDLVHALYPIPSFFPSFRYTTLATVHITSDINKKSIWLRYETLLQKVVFKKVKYVIAVSTNLKEILEEKYHVQNVIYIPHGVDTQHFYPEPQNDEKKERLLNERFEFISLTTGIVGTKTLFIFKMAEQFSNVLFVVLGKEYYPHPPNVKFLSGISENKLKNLYNLADIFLKPLEFATANNSILEAMSMGKPIITDAIPGVFDYLDNDCAFLVENKRDYPEIISQVLENEKERRLKGNKAREKAEKEFDWRVIAEKTIEVYKKVIE
jgi:glycosyltransferase involved in cell wall biosynthesis